MSMSDYYAWKDAARKSADAAIDIYTDREADVERELALHLARALRELDKTDSTNDDETFSKAMDGLVADGLVEAAMTADEAREQVREALEFLFYEDGYTVNQLSEYLVNPILNDLLVEVIDGGDSDA